MNLTAVALTMQARGRGGNLDRLAEAVMDFAGSLVGTLIGSFAGAFLGYQFTRYENERSRAIERGDRWLASLFDVLVKWLNDAVAQSSSDALALKLREVPSIVRKHGQFVEISPQQTAALAKLADAMPYLMAEIAAASIPDGRLEAFERAVLVIESHFGVLRRAVQERTRSRFWPWWPSSR